MDEKTLVPFLKKLQSNPDFKRLTASRTCRSLDSVKIVRTLASATDDSASKELCIWLGTYRTKLILQYALDRNETCLVRDVVLAWIHVACRLPQASSMTMLQWLKHRRMPNFEESLILQRLVDWLESLDRREYNGLFARKWSVFDIETIVRRSRIQVPSTQVVHIAVKKKRPRKRLPSLNTTDDFCLEDDDAMSFHGLTIVYNDESSADLDPSEASSIDEERRPPVGDLGSLSLASDDTFPEELEDGGWLCLDHDIVTENEAWSFLDECSVKSLDSECNVQWSYRDVLLKQVGVSNEAP